MASVPADQNNPDRILSMRASRALYARAKVLAGWQVVLSVVVPVVGALVILGIPDARPYLALYGIVIALVDTCILDRVQKRTIRRAARVQEEFDCQVLDLPWDAFAVGQHPDREDVHEASQRHNNGQEDRTLVDWYPVIAASVAPQFGRIICQRANLRWDAKLRRVVGTWALWLSIVLAVFVAFLALSQRTSLETFVLGFLAPISPILFWGVREYWRQTDAAQLSDRLKTEAERLWELALARGCTAEACAAQSRLFQNGIFERRASGIPVFDWVYRLFRDSFEQQMKSAAEDMVRQIQTEEGRVP